MLRKSGRLISWTLSTYGVDCHGQAQPFSLFSCSLFGFPPFSCPLSSVLLLFHLHFLHFLSLFIFSCYSFGTLLVSFPSATWGLFLFSLHFFLCLFICLFSFVFCLVHLFIFVTAPGVCMSHNLLFIHLVTATQPPFCHSLLSSFRIHIVTSHHLIFLYIN